jgi:arginase
MPETPEPPLALIGVPLELGAGRRGCTMGPAALRTAGIAETLGELGRRVEDLGDIAPPSPAPEPPRAGNAKHFGAIAAWTRAIDARTRAAITDGAFPILLGGDHALAMGSTHAVAAHWRARNRELFVLWLDAHADFNTPRTSPSGNMHGMPVAMLTGEPGFESLLVGAEGRAIDPKNVHLFGIRSVDREERALLAARGLNVVDMRHIDEFGVVAPLKAILEKARARGGVLHVSLDVDFLDPAIAPGVGTDVPGGATYREAHLIMEMLHDCGLVGSLDVVELNPFLDDRGRSALLLVDLVASLFGRRIVDRPA